MRLPFRHPPIAAEEEGVEPSYPGPIEHHLFAYCQLLMREHPGPRRDLKEALRKNLALWSRVYGDAVADQVRKQVQAAWTRLRAETEKQR